MIVRDRPSGLKMFLLLRGSVLRFDAPTAPVADDDWDALQ